MIRKLEDFSYWRRFQRINRWVQILLAILFLSGLNLIAARYYKRIDITKDARYTLSAETSAYLKQLKEPIEIIIAISPDSSNPEMQHMQDDVKQLAKEYAHRTNPSGERLINIEYVNVYQQKKRAEELASRYGLNRENTIIIASAKGFRQLYPGDLYKAEKGKPKLFMGEQMFTSAILNVSSDKRHKIYFLTGHGEMGADDVNPLRGLSELELLLHQQNYDLAQLNLTEHESVPTDAELVICPAPQAPLLPGEEEVLQDYLSTRNGRMIVFLNPSSLHGMDNIFLDWGLLVDDRLVIDTGKDFQVNGGDFLIRRFAQHPITQNLIDYQVGLLTGLWRPVQLDPNSSKDELLIVQMLAASSESSWAKRNTRNSTNIDFDPNHDIKGPISLAVASQRSIGADLGLNIPGGRLVVIGNADMLSNRRLNLLGNHVFVLNTIRWSLDQFHSLNFPPKKVETYQLVISQKDFYQLAFRFAMIPTLLTIAGVCVYFIRRRS